MRRRPPIYGLDIETDTTENGLDPDVAAVVTVALAAPGYEEVFTGDEPQLLIDLDERLRQLEPGVIATWNGAAFDLPFLADRAELNDVDLGLRLREDRTMTMHRAPLPGHRAAYRASWFDHGHIDAYRLYRGDVGPALKISCSLKSIARFVGLKPIEVDRTRIHDLSNEALHAYAASDARLARILTERRWSTASRSIDRVEAGASNPREPLADVVVVSPAHPTQRHALPA
jgi:DNA polymerase elongation subunit (family B)